MSAAPDPILTNLETTGIHLLRWKPVGSGKYPTEKNWTAAPSAKAVDYKPGEQAGILLGTEVAPGRFSVDIDIDWGPGAPIVAALLPDTGFAFGHTSKPLSHLIYTAPHALTTFKYLDVDATSLLEIRGVEKDGTLGHQTMIPPSVWRGKDGTAASEPLLFRTVAGFRHGELGHINQPDEFNKAACLAAIGMILAKHLGKNGFGHEVRLPWCGFLLRAGIPIKDIIKMGEGMSVPCNNLEVFDVKTIVEGTAARMSDSRQRIKGGPSLAKIIGERGKAVIARINEWLGKDSDFIRSTDGMILKDSQDNIRRALQLLEVELTYNEFSERALVQEPQYPPRPITDETHDGLWLRIDREFHFRPSKAFYDVVVSTLVYDYKFHPVRDYLASLTWDGVPRIDTWLHVYGGAPDSEYHRAISSLVLKAAVRRVRQPGCKFDEMLTLESSQQGLNKSSALRALCPDEAWFSDDLPLNVDAKQIIERTLGKWIIEASDLVGGRKADRDHLKSMLSRQIDGPARLAYAHHPVERARQFIIIGTTNSSEYLADPTGARRFWPSKIQRFDVEAILRDRDQLWAEAAVREAAGESIRLPEHLWKVAEGHQEERRTMDAWEGIIEEAIEEFAPPSASGRRQIVTERIWDLLGVETARRDRVGMMRISEIMQRLGFARSAMREEGKLVRGYISDKLIVREKLDFDGGN